MTLQDNISIYKCSNIYKGKKLINFKTTKQKDYCDCRYIYNIINKCF